MAISRWTTRLLQNAGGRSVATVLLVGGGTFGLVAGGTETPLAFRDYTGRGFPPDLVSYTVNPAQAKADRYRLTGPDGQPVAVQVSAPAKDGHATLSFVAELPPNTNLTYVLRDDGQGPLPQAAVSIAREGDSQILSSTLLAVRMPADQEKTFKTPVAASTLPAPLLAFRSGAAGKPWLGAGKLLLDRLVTSLRVRTVASGPVFAEVRYELDFANGGFYHANVQVIDRVPVAKVTEEYDLKELAGTDYWELNLTQGWAPDTCEVAMMNGNGQLDLGKTAPLTELGVTPQPIQPKWEIIPDSSWGPRSILGLFNAAEQKANSNPYTMAGCVPLRKGDWRRMTGIEIQTPDSKQVTLRFPMSVRHATWLRDVTSETSPFSMQEHEPGLPVTYGRRVWGLALAKPSRDWRAFGDQAIGPFIQCRLMYGIVGLDRYKDFILQWPDKKTVYPREFIRQDELARYRKDIDQSPLASLLKKTWYSINGDAAVGRKRTDEAKNRLTWLDKYMVSTPDVEHHIMAANYLIAAACDDALSWAAMPAAEREELRARLALALYLYEDPDVDSYGNGAHTGNPNMGVARTMSMNAFLALAPDHPMFAKWRAHMQAYTEYKAGEMTAPGGGWFEYGAAYQMHGFARLSDSFPGMEAYGADNVDLMLQYIRPDWAYYMNILTPYDSRWFARMVPGMANSMPGYSEHFLEAAGAMAPHDPELAANLKWAWQQNGASDREFNAILDRPWLAPKEPRLTSRIYPGIGVIFRAHQGSDPSAALGAGETYMFLRCGYNWSHWPEDQGHFVLYSKGAALVPFQPYQYWTSPRKEKDFDMANVIRFGSPVNQMPHGWPDANILDHAFGPSVDYALASIGYPDWYISPGCSPDFAAGTTAPVGTGSRRPLAPGITQKEGAFTWNRQVMFLKGEAARSPNYFVFRDTMTGAPSTGSANSPQASSGQGGQLASWFNLNLLGRRKDVKAEGTRLAVDTEWPTKLDILFSRQEPVKPDFYEENQFVALNSGYSGPCWWKGYTNHPAVSRNWVLKDGLPVTNKIGWLENPGFMEQHVFLRIAGAPGQDFNWVVYPRGDGEQSPVVTPLAPGALRIVTAESTDYVFLAPATMKFAGEDVIFEGCAGSVRVGKDNVTLAFAAGAGRIGYKGQVIAASTPFEQTIKLAALRKRADTRPEPSFAISYSPRLSGHKPVAEGVSQASAGDMTEYLISSPASVSFADGDVRLTARHGAVLKSARDIRFVVTDRTEVRLTVGNVGVRGIGPFDLTFAPDRISGTVDGDTRTLVATWPERIVRPMYRYDGHRWYAGWADDHSITKGTPAPQFALALGVTDGKHDVEVSEWTYPPLPSVPERKAIP